MKKSLFALGAAALLLASCGSGDKFNVKVPVPSDLKGQTIAIIDPQTRDTIGSAVASDTIVTISGSVEKPVVALVMAQGYPMYQLIVEPGDITFTDEGLAKGTKANDSYAGYVAKTTSIIDRMKAADEAQGDSILEAELVPAAVDFIKDNRDNPYNLSVFASVAPLMNEAQVRACFEADTVIAANTDAQRVLLAAENKVRTSAGAKYVDLTIQQEDSTLVSLSDYVKPGKYTLVDFWASWCRPCRQEIPGLIELYNKYHASKGLEVVGVAVWDKVADTEAAIKELGINYPVIFNGTRETTDAYGIMGIPCIMLIGPDGTIIARDLFGPEVASTVEAALNK